MESRLVLLSITCRENSFKRQRSIADSLDDHRCYRRIVGAISTSDSVMQCAHAVSINSADVRPGVKQEPHAIDARSLAS